MRHALVVAALAALAGCGGETTPPAADARGVGEARVGSVAPLALCEDWKRGDDARRQATIVDIRRNINLRDTPTRTPELSDEQAHEVFENACAPEYAGGFRLYKLYAQAAGHQSLAAP